MVASFRAEMLVLRKWPAVWALALLGPFLTFFFGYFFPYFDYLSSRSGASAVPSEAVISSSLPDHLIVNVMQAFALYGSATAIVLGGLLAGGDHGRGTLKTSLAQRPTRIQNFAGQALALTGVLLVVLLVTLAIGAICSLVVAVSVGRADSSWPSTSQVVGGIGAGLLVSVAWASFGMALGILFRSAALAIGAGLVWVFVVEGLLEVVALQVGGLLETVRNALPAANTVAITGQFGGAGRPPTSPAVAPWVLAAYAVAFLALGAILLRRRDVS
jgi:ABC-type transport system involved in multi-copper enzyme maturation permease subunit